MKQSRTKFELKGIASTLIRLFAEKPNTASQELVALWQIEVGDFQSPGCHFHCSMNQDDPDLLFQNWLKIPRLPGILVSPLDTLEFLLGELFQVEWEKHMSVESAHRNGWANGQMIRITKVLSWQQKAATDKSYGTPWLSLKKAKPQVDILCEE